MEAIKKKLERDKVTSDLCRIKETKFEKNGKVNVFAGAWKLENECSNRGRKSQLCVARHFFVSEKVRAKMFVRSGSTLRGILNGWL